jgi:signal transduction histidine kinase
MTNERLAVLSHELRSPVAALAALAERANGATLPADTLVRVIALGVAAGRDVERLLADPELLSLRSEKVDLAELLHGFASPRVVVTTQPVELAGDPTRLRQAMANLVANGLRHGTEVTIDARREGDHIVIEVSDDGDGVDPAIDPFARGSSTTGSSGYGLWLAREIAETHGGCLELTSAPALGATFRLSLPLASSVRD